ncbi:MAG: NAD(+) synthase [Firmicutes bacterium]|nr:NAD(+) synthase [Bacillota bacterium]
MRDFGEEFKKRTKAIADLVRASGAKGIVYGNSGGKDSVLVGILCKSACENTLGIMIPCATKRNFGEDLAHGKIIADMFNINSHTVDITAVRNLLIKTLEDSDISLNPSAVNNIAPRLRMTLLYAVASSQNLLVAGTSNFSEKYVGYFTKWGDGACDFNPIADLTAREVCEFLRYLGAPEDIISKPPSGGLFDGQTDETELGISYEKIDDYLLFGKASNEDKALIESLHQKTAHKRN